MKFLTSYLKLCFLILVPSVLTSGLDNETDRHALLEFKEGITQDPNSVMSSWNESAHFCKWMGVTCSLRHRKRVVGIDLGNCELVGTISTSVGNLSFLKSIDLSSNFFNGKIPQEFGRLSRLQQLNLAHNSLGGEIPLNISKCLNLEYFNASYNSIIGTIPFQLASLTKLTYFYLPVNNLTGTIPSWIGNLSSLSVLSFMRNTLHGSIPHELGQLSQLQHFEVSGNMLSGVIPSSLYNITSIADFIVAGNKLQGRIPPNVGLTLPNLRSFLVGLNSFQGPIPVSLSNASMLRKLDFSQNNFTGPIPKNLGSLTSLDWLNLGSNKLGYGRADDLDIITSLSNCSVLEVLALSDNRLGGMLPESLGNLSTHLERLTLWGNLIEGSLPESIENLADLTWIEVQNNLLTGSVPFAVGKLRKLVRLRLDRNKFSGQIPSSLGNLTSLVYLFMNQNQLEGSIPPSLRNCKGLIVLSLSKNKLSGTIPKQVLTLSSLVSFDVAQNSLSGSLPLDVGSLINLATLDISESNLSGQIPVTLSSCIMIRYLMMGGNSFHGPIPQSLKTLRELQFLNLSHNNLTGKIPEFLMNISLLYLDLSYNDLDGEVRKEGNFLDASTISVNENKKLCGGIKELHLPICSEQEVQRSRTGLSRKIILTISLGVLSFILVVISCFAYWLWKFREANKTGDATTSSALEKWKHGASYSEIFKSTSGFSSECLIGTGSFGSVYKGVLSDEETYVAIKVLNLQQKGASKTFIAECEALKNLRHRNLIKVITVCSSIDFEGNDFKALVLEFMPNGSLDRLLHPNVDRSQSRHLSFIQRLNIAIDVAFGLEYLHHSYEDTIVHCDIKPSNILLDTDMTAHIGDFGLARFLFSAANDQPETQTLSSGLKGSIGYIPPEYGIGGRVSALGDMYSYGILLLELFTGMRPTDGVFKDGQSLYDFVAMALPDRVLEIVDASLLSDTQEEDGDGEPGNLNESEEAPSLRRKTTEWKRGECLVSILAIALSCSAQLPKDRTVASDIVNKLIAIRDLFYHVHQTK